MRGVMCWQDEQQRQLAEERAREAKWDGVPVWKRKMLEKKEARAFLLVFNRAVTAIRLVHAQHADAAAQRARRSVQKGAAADGRPAVAGGHTGHACTAT